MKENGRWLDQAAEAEVVAAAVVVAAVAAAAWLARKVGAPLRLPSCIGATPTPRARSLLIQPTLFYRSAVPPRSVRGKAGAGSTDSFGNSKNQSQSGTSSDKWTGGTGTDFFDGGAGADTLKGGLGDDVLVGGTGADRLEGTGGSEVFYGPLLNGADTGTVIIGANAPGGGGWLNPKNPASQADQAFSAFKVSITAHANATVSTSGGATVTSTPVTTTVTGPSGGLWDLTPGSGIMAGHSALVTPHWDPNSPSTVTNADGTTTTTTGAFVTPPPNTQVSDSDFQLDGKSQETESFDLTRANGQIAGFDVLFVGMSGDGNPASTNPATDAGEVAWTAKDADGNVLSQGTLHNIAGSNTLRAGATFSEDAAKHVTHLELTPTGSTVVTAANPGRPLPGPEHLGHRPGISPNQRVRFSDHEPQCQRPLIPISNAGSTWKLGFNADSPDIGVNYRGDILTGGDANTYNFLHGLDGAAGHFRPRHRHAGHPGLRKRH